MELVLYLVILVFLDGRIILFGLSQGVEMIEILMPVSIVKNCWMNNRFPGFDHTQECHLIMIIMKIRK